MMNAIVFKLFCGPRSFLLMAWNRHLLLARRAALRVAVVGVLLLQTVVQPVDQVSAFPNRRNHG